MPLKNNVIDNIGEHSSPDDWQGPQSHPELPSDVLRPIFLYYVSLETNQHPLETLLLVCRLWYITAIGYSQLWSIFHVVIEDGPSAVSWAKNIPRRLKMSEARRRREYARDSAIGATSNTRSQVQTSIYFTIESRFGRTHSPFLNGRTCSIYPEYHVFKCPCRNMIKESIPRIFESLIEPGREVEERIEGGTKNGDKRIPVDGSYWSRWKEIHIRNPSIEYEADQIIAELLSYKMPSLINISLLGVTRPPSGRGNITFLPYTPSLKYLHIEASCLAWLPDTSNAAVIYLQNLGPEMGYPFRNIQALQDAAKLEELYLDIFIAPLITTYLFPINLQFLRILHLGSRFLPDNIKQVQIPNLREIGLHLTRINLFQVVLSCPGIPFPQLNTLRIQLPSKDTVKAELLDYSIMMRSLLRSCRRVEEIYGSLACGRGEDTVQSQSVRPPLGWGGNRMNSPIVSASTKAKKHWTDTGALPFVLRLLREDCASDDGGLLCNRSILVDDGVLARRLRAGMFDMNWDIDRYLEERGWDDVKESWETFVHRWD